MIRSRCYSELRSVCLLRKLGSRSNTTWYLLDRSGQIYSLSARSPFIPVRRCTKTPPSARPHFGGNDGYICYSGSGSILLHRKMVEVYGDYCGHFDTVRNQVDHIDGNRYNNFYKNLRVVSASENMRAAIRLRKERQSLRTLNR